MSGSAGHYLISNMKKYRRRKFLSTSGMVAAGALGLGISSCGSKSKSKEEQFNKKET